jgi:hypothetical protein
MGVMADNRSLDKVYDDYVKEVASGTEHNESATTIAFQYKVAKLQEGVAAAQKRWARISTLIAGVSVAVAIAAVIVAAVN